MDLFSVYYIIISAKSGLGLNRFKNHATGQIIFYSFLKNPERLSGI